MRSLSSKSAGVILVSVAGVQACIAAPILVNVDAIASGWVQHNGDTNGRDSSTTNFVAGTLASNGLDYSNFFVFDLSGVKGTVVSATLQLQNPSNGFYSWENSTFGRAIDYTYYVTQLGTAGSGITASNLLAAYWSYPYTGIASWSTINNGTPTVLGTTLLDESDNGTVVGISLTAEAITGINELLAAPSSDYLYALGGAIDNTGLQTYAFANTGGGLYSRALALELAPPGALPTPPTVLLLASFASLFGFFKMRARHEAPHRAQ